MKDHSTVKFEDTELVRLVDGEPRADTRAICRKLDIGHKDFLNNVMYKYQEDFEQFGILCFENAKKQGR